jgi:hypothetical protein
MLPCATMPCECECTYVHVRDAVNANMHAHKPVLPSVLHRSMSSNHKAAHQCKSQRHPPTMQDAFDACTASCIDPRQNKPMALPTQSGLGPVGTGSRVDSHPLLLKREKNTKAVKCPAPWKLSISRGAGPTAAYSTIQCPLAGVSKVEECQVQ